MRGENEDREQRRAVDKRREEQVEAKRRKSAAVEEEGKQNDKGKRAPPLMKGQGKNQHLEAGKKGAQGGRGNSEVADSIRQGETIRGMGNILAKGRKTQRRMRKARYAVLPRGRLGNAGETSRRSEESRSEGRAKEKRYQEPTFTRKPQWRNGETTEWERRQWEMGKWKLYELEL